MRHSIYTLSHPSTGEIFYVGCTYDIKKRLRAHTYGSAKSLAKNGRLRDPKDHYILSQRINPVCHIIEDVFGTQEQASIREGFWISFLIENGFPIVNKWNRSKIAAGKCDINDLPTSFMPIQVKHNYRKFKRLILEETSAKVA